MPAFTIKATIPVVNYGNISPELTIEAETFAEAQAIAMPQIEALWAQYCSPGSELKKRDTTTDLEFETIVSTMCDSKTFYFNAEQHIYKDENGNTDFLSGSKFAHKYVPPFPKEEAIIRCAQAWGSTEDEVRDMWKLKGDSSGAFGTGIHAALELYGKHKELGKVAGAKKGINAALHTQPLLTKIVSEFYKTREHETALYEAGVISKDGKRIGQLDRTLIVDPIKKICRVQDFKTNDDITTVGSPKTLLAPFTDMENTKLNSYWLQLSFYASILEEYGWTVEGLDIFHYTDKWVTYTRPRIKLEKELLGA